MKVVALHQSNTNMAFPIILHWLLRSISGDILILSLRISRFQIPNFEGLPRLFRLELSLKTFVGVTRTLVEPLGAEKPLIGIFSQMVPDIG